MTPLAIVKAAREANLDVIAICDHNSARNAAATRRAAKESGVSVIPGLEITSSEEVHILGLFPSDERAAAVQDEVYARLFGENEEEVFGYQVVVDEFDQVDDMDQRLLIGATTLNTEKIVDLIHEFGGLAIASHVDRQGFGIFNQLGFIPPGLKLDALEISKKSDPETMRKRYRQCNDFPLVTASDAHYLEDIGSAVTVAQMAGPTFDELVKAIKGLDGRAIVDLKSGFERNVTS
jgi:predicted metal-dependent phosphoesterase TrpH